MFPIGTTVQMDSIILVTVACWPSRVKRWAVAGPNVASGRLAAAAGRIVNAVDNASATMARAAVTETAAWWAALRPVAGSSRW